MSSKLPLEKTILGPDISVEAVLSCLLPGFSSTWKLVKLQVVVSPN